MKSIRAHALLLLVGFLTVACAAALYGYMYWSVGTSAGRALLARDIAAAETLDKSREQSLTKTYVDTGAERERLKSYFLDRDDVVSFVEAIEALGPKSGAGIKISSLSLTGARVEAEGSWSSVMRALKLSETLPYGTIVSNVRLSTSGTGDKAPIWSLSYDLSVMTKD